MSTKKKLIKNRKPTLDGAIVLEIDIDGEYFYRYRKSISIDEYPIFTLSRESKDGSQREQIGKPFRKFTITKIKM